MVDTTPVNKLLQVELLSDSGQTVLMVLGFVAPGWAPVWAGFCHTGQYEKFVNVWMMLDFTV